MVTIRPVIVGISAASGRAIPPFVSRLGSSLRTRTLAPMGSMYCNGLDFFAITGSPQGARTKRNRKDCERAKLLDAGRCDKSPAKNDVEKRTILRSTKFRLVTHNAPCPSLANNFANNFSTPDSVVALERTGSFAILARFENPVSALASKMRADVGYVHSLSG